LKCQKKFLPKYFVGKKIRNSLFSRGAQMPQNSRKKTYFLIDLNHFFYKNEPIDLVRGLFSNQDIGPCIPLTWGPLITILGPFGGAQMPQNSIKNYFLVVLDHFSYKNEPIDLVRGLFSS
jgi:hypothetical protein